jgi:hypothetical protein
MNSCPWATNTPNCDCAEWLCPHQPACDRPATTKLNAEWFCDPHADEMSSLTGQGKQRTSS